jgi:hypothetical protein
MLLRITSVLYILNAAACGAFPYLTRHGVVSTDNHEIIQILLIVGLMMLGVILGAAIAFKVGETASERNSLGFVLMAVFFFVGWGAGIWLFPSA